MKKLMLILALVSMVALMAWPAAAEDHAFVGLKKCGMCHKKDAAGNQLGKWTEGPHAKAFTELSSEAGLAKAKELGVADPTTDGACLSCHVTGHGVDAALTAKLLPENGVTCESCHGAGGDYYKKKTMTAIAAGEVDGGPLGLIEPNEQVCLGCHKADNPGHTGTFNFEEAIKTISHPIPAATE